MLRGKPFLARHMERTRIKGTKVRPRSNPETEPNFYSMPPIDDLASKAYYPTWKQEEHDDKENKRRTPSPSPAVVDTRSPNQKLGSFFVPSASVVPDDATSSSAASVSAVAAAAAPPPNADDNDCVIIFEGRPFHYLDIPPVDTIGSERRITTADDATTKPSLVPSHPQEVQGSTDALFSLSEMDAMLARLDKPGGIWSINVNDMDDAALGTVLETLVIDGDKKYCAQV